MTLAQPSTAGPHAVSSIARSQPAAEPIPASRANTYAAIDLGSNSFHLIVASWDMGRLRVLDKHKEMVRLADGLGDDDQLDPAVCCRALDCLMRFGQRIRGLPPQNIRVVGTNTLRRARADADFLGRSEAALGRRIEVISGREEARLIYLGVSHALEDDSDRRLVVDIGGGSTELVNGQHFAPLHMESLYMGCVELSRRYFPGGGIDAERMARAELHARQELAPVDHLFHRNTWDTAIGASGTLLALGSISRGLGLTRGGITARSIEAISDRLVRAGHIERIDLPGLSAQRRPVIAGGAAIARALFHTLEIDHMQLSNRALREGLLFDLIGRTHDQDVRETSILQLQQRFRIDIQQAGQVAETARYLFDAVAEQWNLDPVDDGKLLRWAAMVHEIGLDIAHASYHKHGAYLLEYLDLPGFSASQQQLLAFLVRTHRRKLPLDLVPGTSAMERQRLLRLGLCLRLAVLLHRNRSGDPLPPIQTQSESDRLSLTFPTGWLEVNPLTVADLEQESAYQRVTGMKLRVA